MRNVRQAPPPLVPPGTVTPAPQPVPPAQMPGGAPGIPGLAPASATSSAPRLDPRRTAGPKPKRYRVVNGGHVVFNGCRTALRAGKEVSDLTYDVAHLRRQGIKLEEIVDEVPPAPALPEPSAETSAPPPAAPAAE